MRFLTDRYLDKQVMEKNDPAAALSKAASAARAEHDAGEDDAYGSAHGRSVACDAKTTAEATRKNLDARAQRSEVSPLAWMGHC